MQGRMEEGEEGERNLGKVETNVFLHRVYFYTFCFVHRTRPSLPACVPFATPEQPTGLRA